MAAGGPDQPFLVRAVPHSTFSAAAPDDAFREVGLPNYEPSFRMANGNFIPYFVMAFRESTKPAEHEVSGLEPVATPELAKGISFYDLKHSRIHSLADKLVQQATTGENVVQPQLAPTALADLLQLITSNVGGVRVVKKCHLTFDTLDALLLLVSKFYGVPENEFYQGTFAFLAREKDSRPPSTQSIHTQWRMCLRVPKGDVIPAPFCMTVDTVPEGHLTVCVPDSKTMQRPDAAVPADPLPEIGSWRWTDTYGFKTCLRHYPEGVTAHIAEPLQHLNWNIHCFSMSAVAHPIPDPDGPPPSLSAAIAIDLASWFAAGVDETWETPILHITDALAELKYPAELNALPPSLVKLALPLLEARVHHLQKLSAAEEWDEHLLAQLGDARGRLQQVASFCAAGVAVYVDISPVRPAIFYDKFAADLSTALSLIAQRADLLDVLATNLAHAPAFRKALSIALSSNFLPLSLIPREDIEVQLNSVYIKLHRLPAGLAAVLAEHGPVVAGIAESLLGVQQFSPPVISELRLDEDLRRESAALAVSLPRADAELSQVFEHQVCIAVAQAPAAMRNGIPFIVSGNAFTRGLFEYLDMRRAAFACPALKVEFVDHFLGATKLHAFHDDNSALLDELAKGGFDYSPYSRLLFPPKDHVFFVLIIGASKEFFDVARVSFLHAVRQFLVRSPQFFPAGGHVTEYVSEHRCPPDCRHFS